MPFKIQIASMTSLTPAGGCFIVFITVMSCRETTLNYPKTNQPPILTETAATTNSISTEVKGAAVDSYRWRECIESSKGSFQDRNGFTQVLITFIFYCLSCCSLLVCDCLVCFHHLYNKHKQWDNTPWDNSQANSGVEFFTKQLDYEPEFYTSR